MGAITIRNLSEETIRSIKIAAATKGLSMEAELRSLIGGTYPARKTRSPDEVQAFFLNLYGGKFPKNQVDDFLAHRHEDFDD